MTEGIAYVIFSCIIGLGLYGHYIKERRSIMATKNMKKAKKAAKKAVKKAKKTY